MVQAHAYIRIIMLFVLSNFLEEVLEIYLRSSGADCVLVSRVLFIEMRCHIDVSQNFLRLEY